MKTVTAVLLGISLFVAARSAVAPQSARSDDAKRKPAETAKPNDSKAEETKADEANTLIAKGKAEAREAQRPETAAERDALQTQAREDFGAAREICQADHDRYKKVYDKFDKFIPKDQTAKYEARELAFRR